MTDEELDAIVWWTREPEEALHGKFSEHLALFEQMTVREARQYWYGNPNYPPLSPSEIQKIIENVQTELVAV